MNAPYIYKKPKPRTIRSLALQCLKRYPVPMTAWQIGRIIGKNPASVSSQLNRMHQKGLVFKFEGKEMFVPDRRVLYITLHAITKFDLHKVIKVYSTTDDLKDYKIQREFEKKQID